MKEDKINSDIHICINTKEEIKHITLLYGDPDRKLPKGVSVLDIVKDCLTEDEYKEYEELFTTYVKTKPFTNEIKRKIVNSLLSNLTLRDGKLSYTYKKPFDILAKGLCCSKWWAAVDSNHRPHAYQACALTT